MTTPFIPTFMTRLPPREVQAEGYPWSHQVTIALPKTYGVEPDRRYPVLWVTDPATKFDLVATTVSNLLYTGEVPEMIVVGVGSDPQLPFQDFTTRRLMDFGAREDWTFTGMVESPTSPFRTGPGGGADDFLALLVDTIRPPLAAEFRTDPEINVLSGHSGGGVFAAYTLLTRPDAFTHYLCASAPATAMDFLLFELEDRYAATHEDLPARVHIVVGEKEHLEPGMVELDLFGSTARLARALHLRHYPSLDLSFQVIPGERHVSMQSAGMLEGLRALFRDQSAAQ